MNCLQLLASSTIRIPPRRFVLTATSRGSSYEMLAALLIMIWRSSIRVYLISGSIPRPSADRSPCTGMTLYCTISNNSGFSSKSTLKSFDWKISFIILSYNDWLAFLRISKYIRPNSGTVRMIFSSNTFPTNPVTPDIRTFLLLKNSRIPMFPDISIICE